MDKIKEITDIILSEAEAKADQIREHAEQTIARDKAEYEADRIKLSMESEKTTNSALESIRIRSQSLTESRLRQLKLAQRQELIQAVLDQTVEQFRNLPDQQKIDLYAELICRKNIKEGKIRVNQSEQKILDGLLQQLGDGFSKGEPIAIQGGLIVLHDLIEENFSIDLILRDKRSELSSLIAEILFN